MKKFAPIAVILAIFGLIVALINKPKNEQPTQDTTAKSESTAQGSADQELIIVTPWEITSTDPAKSGNVFQRLELAETLVNADQNATLTPALATAWKSNDTATEWEFDLRAGVKFHDDTPLTADAVIKSLKVALSKPTALEKAKIKSIDKVDDDTVRFVLEQPLRAFPAYLAHSTALILAPKSFNDKDEVVEVIGTGAYKVVKIEAPQKIDQIAFDGYWGGKAKIQKVSYLANSRSETRTLLAQSKPNYLVYNLDGASLEKLQGDSNLNVISKPIARTIQYKVNGSHPLFSDVKVRQILNLALDRKGMSQSVLKNQDGGATLLLPPLFKDYQINIEDKSPDYTTLKNELIALGFGQDDKGNLLYKDGKPVSFTLKTFSDRPELPVIATAMQDQFKKLGINVNVAVGNFSDIPASHQDGSLEMALYARNYGLIPDPLGALMEDFDPKGADWGVMNWQNQELTDTLAKLNASTDESEKATLKQRISQIIYDEQPITPVVYYQQNVASNKALKNVELDSFERSFNISKMSW